MPTGPRCCFCWPGMELCLPPSRPQALQRAAREGLEVLLVWEGAGLGVQVGGAGRVPGLCPDPSCTEMEFQHWLGRAGQASPPSSIPSCLRDLTQHVLCVGCSCIQGQASGRGLWTCTTNRTGGGVDEARRACRAWSLPEQRPSHLPSPWGSLWFQGQSSTIPMLPVPALSQASWVSAPETRFSLCIGPLTFEFTKLPQLDTC